MDSLTTLAVDYATGLVIDKVAGTFWTRVIEPWTKKKADTFFQQFCKSVCESHKYSSDSQLQKALDTLLENESSSEKMYDAYRSLCVSRSKLIGPRIIAVITAMLINDNRPAAKEEKSLFAAAETLDDSEFREFRAFFEEKLEKGLTSGRKNADVSVDLDKSIMDVKLTDEQIDSNGSHREKISVGPLSLDDYLGTWAEKLRATGILTHDVFESNWEYKEDGERYIDEPGSVREISWWIHFGPISFRLRDLVNSLDY
jgi:hypothetical protein